MKKFAAFAIPIILAGLLICVVMIFMGGTNKAEAQAIPKNIIAVNTLEDEDNVDGDCSLREAIRAAGENDKVDACPPGDAEIPDFINFIEKGTIIISPFLEVGDGGPVEIDGESLVELMGGTGWWDQFIHVGGFSQLTLNGLTFTHAPGVYGGVIDNQGVLTINNCIFSGNTSFYGGAISNSSSIVKINSSTFLDNFATGGGAVYNIGIALITDTIFINNEAQNTGGAINNYGDYSFMKVSGSVFTANQSGIGGAIANAWGTFILENNTFTGNESWEGPGAILNYGGITEISSNVFTGNDTHRNYGGGAVRNSDGQMSISGSIFTGNVAPFGGAVTNESWEYPTVITITRSNFSGNTAFYNGGSIENLSGRISIFDSVISNNNADIGGGIFNKNGSLVFVENSTISNNSARIGGGIENWSDSTITITHSTMDGNRATSHGGGIDNHGSMRVINSTISRNQAHQGGGILQDVGGSTHIQYSTLAYNQADIGGSISNNGGNVLVNSSIIANSTLGGNCSWVIEDGGFNLSSDNTCGFDPANHSLPDTDPLLGPFLDYGGDTKTFALLLGSPAIDAADGATCPASDQRYVTRPVDGDGDGIAACDIGSYELQLVPPQFVAITGESEGLVRHTYLFTATVEPVTAAQPINYTWQVDGQGAFTHMGFTYDEMPFSWLQPGTYTITVTASNPFGTATGSKVITIVEIAHETYAPIVNHNW